MILRLILILAPFVILLIAACTATEKTDENKSYVCAATRAPAEHVQAQLDKLAPVVLTCDISSLPDSEQQALKCLIKAAQCMDEAFFRQVYEWNYCIAKEFDELGGPEDRVYQDYYRIMFGPWDRLDHNKPFLDKVEKPLGANFYPMDMTKEEFEGWLKKHPEDQEAFEGNFTVIRRSNDQLAAIPYSRYFKDWLEPAAERLRAAAKATKDPTLKTFLDGRAEAFFTDDYFQSDMDWMDLAGDIEVVIGPYEVYEDELFGYKAAFESFVCVVDHEASAKQKEIGDYLDEMEKNLPNPEGHKNFERGAASPIKVVNEVFAGGDTKAGIQTIAFNLPNDERVREEKGSKKVMLKNVMIAKFEKCLKPISDLVLTQGDRKRISSDAYFYHILLHEVSHGLGPGKIVLNGKETTVNKALKDLYSTIEECKADVLGIYNTQFLINKGVLPKSLEESLYATYLGGMFRSIRFGINEAHGGGIAIQLNWCLDKGGFGVNPDGSFFVNEDKIRDAVKDLSREVLILEAEGDYEGAKKLIKKYRTVRPEVKAALKKLEHLPVDIRPVYPLAED